MPCGGLLIALLAIPRPKDDRYGRYRTYFTGIVDEVGTVGISNAHLHPRLGYADFVDLVGTGGHFDSEGLPRGGSDSFRCQVGISARFLKKRKILSFL